MFPDRFKTTKHYKTFIEHFVVLCARGKKGRNKNQKHFAVEREPIACCKSCYGQSIRGTRERSGGRSLK